MSSPSLLQIHRYLHSQSFWKCILYSYNNKHAKYSTWYSNLVKIKNVWTPCCTFLYWAGIDGFYWIHVMHLPICTDNRVLVWLLNHTIMIMAEIKKYQATPNAYDIRNVLRCVHLPICIWTLAYPSGIHENTIFVRYFLSWFSAPDGIVTMSGRKPVFRPLSNPFAGTTR